MEEQSSLIIQTLPPILTSIGGFFILIFFGFGQDDKQKRLLAAAILVLLIWSIYISVTIAGEQITMFSSFITVVCLIISMVIFIVVFYLNIRLIATNQTTLLTLFVIGILFSTSGFVNYFGMKNRTVIAISSSLCKGKMILKKVVNEGKFNVSESEFLGKTGFVINTRDISDIKKISYRCDGEDDNENKLEAFKKSSRGLGEEYVYDNYK